MSKTRSHIASLGSVGLDGHYSVLPASTAQLFELVDYLQLENRCSLTQETQAISEREINLQQEGQSIQPTGPRFRADTKLAIDLDKYLHSAIRCHEHGTTESCAKFEALCNLSAELDRETKRGKKYLPPKDRDRSSCLIAARHRSALCKALQDAGRGQATEFFRRNNLLEDGTMIVTSDTPITERPSATRMTVADEKLRRRSQASMQERDIAWQSANITDVSWHDNLSEKLRGGGLRAYRNLLRRRPDVHPGATIDLNHPHNLSDFFTHHNVDISSSDALDNDSGKDVPRKLPLHQGESRAQPSARSSTPRHSSSSTSHRPERNPNTTARPRRTAEATTSSRATQPRTDVKTHAATAPRTRDSSTVGEAARTSQSRTGRQHSQK